MGAYMSKEDSNEVQEALRYASVNDIKATIADWPPDMKEKLSSVFKEDPTLEFRNAQDVQFGVSQLKAQQAVTNLKDQNAKALIILDTDSVGKEQSFGAALAKHDVMVKRIPKHSLASVEAMITTLQKVGNLVEGDTSIYAVLAIIKEKTSLHVCQKGPEENGMDETVIASPLTCAAFPINYELDKHDGQSVIVSSQLEIITLCSMEEVMIPASPGQAPEKLKRVCYKENQDGHVDLSRSTSGFKARDVVVLNASGTTASEMQRLYGVQIIPRWVNLNKYINDEFLQTTEQAPKKDPGVDTLMAHVKRYGSLSLEEFTTFILNEKLGLTPAQVVKMFKHADAEGHGSISKSELEALFVASHTRSMSVPVRIIVPSTHTVSSRISDADMKNRVDAVISLMASSFGGATATASERGAYRADNGDIVFEEVVSVTSFCTPSLWKKKDEVIREKVQEFCKDWGQECIGLEFAGFLEYVYPEEPSSQALWDSVAERLSQRTKLRI